MSKVIDEDPQQGIGSLMLGAGEDWDAPPCEFTKEQAELLKDMAKRFGVSYRECCEIAAAASFMRGKCHE